MIFMIFFYVLTILSNFRWYSIIEQLNVVSFVFNTTCRYSDFTKCSLVVLCILQVPVWAMGHWPGCQWRLVAASLPLTGGLRVFSVPSLSGPGKHVSSVNAFTLFLKRRCLVLHFWKHAGRKDACVFGHLADLIMY